MRGPADELSREAALARLQGPRPSVLRKFVDQRIEIPCLAEIAINRGKTHISDTVESAQTFHDELANLSLGISLSP